MGNSIDRTQLCRRLSLPHTLQIVVLATDKTVNSPRNGRSSFSRSRGEKVAGNSQDRLCETARGFCTQRAPSPAEIFREHHKRLTPVAFIYRRAWKTGIKGRSRSFSRDMWHFRIHEFPRKVSENVSFLQRRNLTTIM